MELTNQFRVGVPVETAWAVLTDVERIAPCLPGAQLQEIEGDEYRGIVKVKVGPITAQYKGAATFQEKDDAAHKAVLKAEGRETRGQGNASAIITALLEADGDSTNVSVITDLTVTGKVAQFGRGVLADVSSKLLDQFVDSLEKTVLSADSAAVPAPEPEPVAEPESTEFVPTPEPAAEAEPEPVSDAEMKAAEPTAPVESEPAPEPAPTVRKIDMPEPEPVDLLGTAGSPVLKRAAPIITALVLLFFLGRRRRRRRARHS